jgi:hypothetical protein
VGVSLNGVSNAGLLSLSSSAAGAQVQGRTQPNSLARRLPDSTSQSDTVLPSQSAPDAGTVYSVPDAVALQSQLRGTVGANDPAATGAGDGAAAGTRAASSIAATRQAAAASATPSAAVQRDENLLLSALESLRLSPIAIQEFMNIGNFLAQASPALFQAFLNAVTGLTQTAGAASLSGATTVAAAANPPLTTQTVGTTTGGALSSIPQAANSSVEVTTVQVSAAEVQVASATSGKGNARSKAEVGGASYATLELLQPSHESSAATAPPQSLASKGATGAPKGKVPSASE